MESPKYAFIDSLRGLAIMLVLLVHTGQQFNQTYFHLIFKDFLENGQLGVQLFYLVSSFTLMLSCRSREGESNFKKKFFIRRFFRIAPVYYLVTVYYTFERYLGFNASQFGDHLHNFPIIKLITGMLFINGFYPTTMNSYVPGGWSIAVEMMFYIMLPIIFNKIRTLRQSILLFSVSLLLSVWFRSLLINPFFEKGNFCSFNFINQFPMFCLGIIAYFVVRDGLEGLKTKDYLVLAFLFLFSCYFQLPYYMIYSLFFFFLLIGLSKGVFVFIVNPATMFIGKIGFSIYLIHFAVIYWASQVVNLRTIDFSNAIISYLAYLFYYFIILSLTSFIAYFSYKYIEIPSQKQGRKIIETLK